MLFLRRCPCQLTWKEHILDVSVSIKFDKAGDIRLVFDPVPVRSDTSFLHSLFDSRAESFVLQGRTRTGRTLTCPAAHLVSKNTRHDSNGAFITVSATTYDIDIVVPRRRKQPIQSGFVEYWVAGLKSFGPLSSDSTLGKFSIVGAGRSKDHSSLNSYVRVDSAAEVQGDLVALDGCIDRLLEILSLASGRFLNWSVRRFFSEPGGLRIHGRGPGIASLPMFPMFPYQDLRPVVDSALANYTASLRESTGLGVAIAWSLMHPPYPEADFLCGMTALEHLVDVDSEETGLLPKPFFKSVVRPAVEHALRTAMSANVPGVAVQNPSETEIAMIQKVPDLNRRSLRQNVESFLDRKRVPIDDISSQIPGLVKLRNDIVHRGIGSDVDALFDLSAVLRELLARVFLQTLSYKGPYISYLKGRPEVKQFG